MQLGSENIDISHKKVIEEFCKSRWFSGALGGHYNLAYYIFGMIDHEFLYLDPHKIRKGNKIKNFEVNEFFKISYEELHPNISLCFKIDSFESFRQFINFANKLNDPFIECVFHQSSECSIEEISSFRHKDENTSSIQKTREESFFMLDDQSSTSNSDLNSFLPLKLS